VVDFGEDVSSGVASLQGTKWTHENGRRYIADDLKHLDVKRQLLRGDPAHQILQTAKESNTDLIMMPSHGLSSFRRYILGSITAKVLHDAEGPVWTSVHLENLPVLEDIRFRKVLCAIDLGAQSADALRWAAGFAKEHSAELLAVHVVPAWEARRYKFVNEPIVNVLEHQARRQLHELLESSGIDARMIVASGEPAKVVSEIAQAENVDQMVIARGSAADGLGRLRGNAYAIIRSAPCPVVSV
jgi:nucleotide-binding universal stress UspA family protein